jgi:hypothetical protein
MLTRNLPKHLKPENIVEVGPVVEYSPRSQGHWRKTSALFLHLAAICGLQLPLSSMHVEAGQQSGVAKHGDEGHGLNK